MAKKSKSKTSRKSVRKAVSRKAAKKAVVVKKKAAKAAKKAVAKPAMKKAAPKPAGKFNMLVTFDPSHRGIAELELKTVLKQVGEVPKMAATGIDGLYKLAVKDARNVVKKVTALVGSNPAIFVATRHYIPVDRWVKAEVPQMKDAVKSLCAGIGSKEKWKMSLNKRHWDKMESTPLIMRLTEVVESRNVDLDKPDKIIQTEIIANEAGISLLKPSEIADIQRIKAK
jgi:tRNA(Ser,Leu) C12 N-acetylase TAN1